MIDLASRHYLIYLKMNSALNLPNTLTVIRIILIPVFVMSIIYERLGIALLVFVLAAVTDALDGLLARIRKEKTALGAFLDPLADKFLIITSFVVFSYYGWVPGWLTIIVISRDIVVLVGWVLIYLMTHATEVKPSYLGKSAIAVELIFLPYVLLNVRAEFLPSMKEPLIILTTILTIASGIDYILKGLRKVR